MFYDLNCCTDNIVSCAPCQENEDLGFLDKIMPVMSTCQRRIKCVANLKSTFEEELARISPFKEMIESAEEQQRQAAEDLHSLLVVGLDYEVNMYRFVFQIVLYLVLSFYLLILQLIHIMLGNCPSVGFTPLIQLHSI